MQQIFIEHLLYPRHSSGTCHTTENNTGNTFQSPGVWGLTLETDNVLNACLKYLYWRESYAKKKVKEGRTWKVCMEEDGAFRGAGEAELHGEVAFMGRLEGNEQVLRLPESKLQKDGRAPVSARRGSQGWCFGKNASG